MKIGENWRLDVLGRMSPADDLVKSPIMILLTAIASRYSVLKQTKLKTRQASLASSRRGVFRLPAAGFRPWGRSAGPGG
jgi:hypothetical protein